MDRNLIDEIQLEFNSVALRKESVDRNSFSGGTKSDTTESLSARRAWIEIHKRLCAQRRYRVALRKESVDRNSAKNVQNASFNASLSARRAWIEISLRSRLGGVEGSRSPQGERG